MYDVSDEATGLPPLEEVDPAISIFAVHWLIGVEGMVTLTSEPAPVPVRYISFRGIVHDENGDPTYGQVHVALPHSAIRPMLEQWLAVLDQEEIDATPDNPPSS